MNPFDDSDNNLDRFDEMSDDNHTTELCDPRGQWHWMAEVHLSYILNFLIEIKYNVYH